MLLALDCFVEVVGPIAFGDRSDPAERQELPNQESGDRGEG